MDILNLLQQQWHWAFSGCMLTLAMVLLALFGKELGISSTFRTICAIGGGGHLSEFFRVDWKAQLWNIIFVIGIIIGACIATRFLSRPYSFTIHQDTLNHFAEMGIVCGASEYLPDGIFGVSSFSVRNLFILITGGLMVGFGTRWAGGCTSGHFLSGISNLQLPSFITLIGFILGGAVMTNVIFPMVF